MTVQDRVLRVIAQEGHRALTAAEVGTTFDELGVDSLDKVCILFGLEKEFDVSIPEEDARRFASVRQVIDWLNRPAAVSPAPHSAD